MGGEGKGKGYVCANRPGKDADARPASTAARVFRPAGERNGCPITFLQRAVHTYFHV